MSLGQGDKTTGICDIWVIGCICHRLECGLENEIIHDERLDVRQEGTREHLEQNVVVEVHVECAELTPCQSVHQCTVKQNSCSVYIMSFVYKYLPSLLVEQSIFMNQSCNVGKVAVEAIKRLQCGDKHRVMTRLNTLDWSDK